MQRCFDGLLCCPAVEQEYHGGTQLHGGCNHLRGKRAGIGQSTCRQCRKGVAESMLQQLCTKRVVKQRLSGFPWFSQSHQIGLVVKTYNTFGHYVSLSLFFRAWATVDPQDDRRERTYFKLTGDGGKEQDLLRAQDGVPQ